MVDEHKLSLGKNYDIVVGGEVVATVTGKFFKLGDTFTMKDPNGKPIMIAEEDYKWHALLDRNFTLRDPNGTILGFIGDEALEQKFTIGWKFYFYDKDRKEIGQSSQINYIKFGILKENMVFNNKSETLYNVSADFVMIGGDTYHIKVIKKDDKDIPIFYQIFMVCAEDAIHDKKREQR